MTTRTPQTTGLKILASGNIGIVEPVEITDPAHFPCGGDIGPDPAAVEAKARRIREAIAVLVASGPVDIATLLDLVAMLEVAQNFAGSGEWGEVAGVGHPDGETLLIDFTDEAREARGDFTVLALDPPAPEVIPDRVDVEHIDHQYTAAA